MKPVFKLFLRRFNFVLFDHNSIWKKGNTPLSSVEKLLTENRHSREALVEVFSKGFITLTLFKSHIVSYHYSVEYNNNRMM